MKDSISERTLGYGAAIKRTRAAIVENAGKTVALITGIVVALVTFTEISFYDFRTTEFLSSALLLLLGAYIIYFSLEDAGERLGRGEEIYLAEVERYRTAVERLRQGPLGGFREFLELYSREELAFRVRGYLFSHGYSEDALARYQSGEKFSKEAVRVFRRAERMRAVTISPSRLLGSGRTSPSELAGPARSRMARLLLGLVPTSACMLFTFSIMLGARDGMTAEFIIESILKLSGLPIIALRGYTVGYNFALGDGRGWLMTKTEIIEEYLRKSDGSPNEVE